MPSFKEMVEKYKKRRHDTVVDAVTTGLSLADNVTVDLGLLEDTGVATEIAETVSNVLPFAVIAVTEQCKVLLGKKTGAAGAGAVVALPAAVSARVIMDRYRGYALMGHRVSLRTQRLKALNTARLSRTSAGE